jgi:ubiquinone biosynthesis protein UbiJ
MKDVIIPVTFFLTTAAVILLAPITRRIGRYLEVLIEEKRAALRGERDAAAREAVDALARRVELLEERMEFAERLALADRLERAERLMAPAEPRELERR